MRAGVSFVLHKLHKFVQSDEKDRAAFLDTEKTGVNSGQTEDDNL